MTTERPMRILTVANVPPDPNSGAAGTVWHTNVALRDLGHEVDEIWADDLGPRRIQHGNLHSLLEQPRAYRREVLKAVAKNEYDVVMMSQPQAYLAAKALKQGGFKGLVINRSHGVELRSDAIMPEWHRRLGVPESRSRWLTALLRRRLQRQWSQIARWCDGIIVPCHDDRKSVLEFIRVLQGVVEVIPHGVTQEFFGGDALPITHDRATQLLYVGQSALFKGPQLTAQIVNRVLAVREHLTMTWITSSATHQWLQSLIEPTVADRVFMLDWQPNDQLPAIYDQHGVFLFPTLVEGAGKVSLEAMSRGLCVVTARHSGMKDYITDRQNGCLCSNGDIGEYAARIVELTDDPQKMIAMGEAARRRGMEYPWSACAARMEAFFRRLSGKPVSAQHRSSDRLCAAVTENRPFRG